MHALVILAVIYLAIGPVGRIPLAALAGVLMVTSFRMIGPDTIRDVLRSTRSDAVTFVVTAVITVAFDFIEAVRIGPVVAASFALRRLARAHPSITSRWFSLTAGYDTPFVFAQPGTARAERKPGLYEPLGTDSWASRLEVSEPDTSGRGAVLTLTESDGTVTTWTWTDGAWLAGYERRTVIAEHERLSGKVDSRLDLDHYLEALVRKPGALPGATALAQARAAGKFTPVHDAWWDAARKAHGDATGTRALIDVLLLHRHLAHEHVVAGLAAALTVGALTADAVALEARKAADETPAGETRPGPSIVDLRRQVANVTSLTAHRLRTGQLPADTRPLPDMTKYDALLPSRQRSTGPTDQQNGQEQARPMT